MPCLLRSARRLAPLGVTLALAACTPARSASDAPAPEPLTLTKETTAYEFADPERRKKIEAALPALDGVLETELRAQHMPSIAFGVVVDGALVYAKGFGTVDLAADKKPDADTVYRIGSVTKSFTALAILALRDQGKLGLDDPLAKYIPEARGLVYPTADSQQITLRQLLTHTSGLPRLGHFDYTRPDREPSESEVLGSLSKFALENPPGTAHVYSNLGFGLLGIVASRAAGIPYRDVVGREILGPLGMTSTTFDRAKVPDARLAVAYRKEKSGKLVPATHWRLGASEGAGGLYSTLADMARYAAFELAAYPPRNEPEQGRIRRSSVREAHYAALRSGGLHVTSRDAARGEPTVRARAIKYGFAWVVDETCEWDRLVWHNGAVDGFAANVTILPERGIATIALTNLVESNLEAVTDKALRMIAKSGALQRRVARATPTPSFPQVMAKFLTVLNAWNEDTYKAMLTPKRKVQQTEEQEELAGYRSLHGACSGYAPVVVMTPFHARFAMQCEKGALEMDVLLDPGDGLIRGFNGTSRGIPAAAKLGAAATALAGLIEAWDDAVYKTYLEPHNPNGHAGQVSFFERLRGEQGKCSVKEYTHEPEKDVFRLGCENGSDLKLDLKVDDQGAVKRYAITPEGTGPCPVR